MLFFAGEMQARVADGGVWIEINNPDPVDGPLDWAFVTTADALKLIKRISECIQDIDTPCGSTCASSIRGRVDDQP